MVPLSVLDLSPIVEGGDAGQSLRHSLDLARHVETLGYRRFWMAEHHNLPGIASAATAVALAHIAAGTRSIRIGAGGIMLPNHAPLLIAEQFGTLAALHPGRVELGLGRAPGSDQITAHAMRRTLAGGEEFPQDVVELMAYFKPAQPGQRVVAVSFTKDLAEPEGVPQPSGGRAIAINELYDGNPSVDSVAIGGPYNIQGPGDTQSRPWSLWRYALLLVLITAIIESLIASRYLSVEKEAA